MTSSPFVEIAVLEHAGIAVVAGVGAGATRGLVSLHGFDARSPLHRTALWLDAIRCAERYGLASVCWFGKRCDLDGGGRAI